MIHKAIKGFENYLVSDTGRVYSLKRGRYLKAIKNRDGYLRVGLCKNGKIKFSLIHRLVAEAFIVNPENKPTVDHINRIKTDNRVENLRWASYSEQNKNQSHINQVSKTKEKYGVPIIEVINDEVSVAYLSLGEVPNIDISSLRYRINKGETDFTIKQHNGSVRHFKLPSKQK